MALIKRSNGTNTLDGAPASVALPGGGDALFLAGAPSPQDTITGDAGDNNLTDTPGNDTIDAQGGNDTITVTSGSDTIAGGLGSDRLILDYAAATQDVLTGSGPAVNNTDGGFNGYYSDTNGITVSHQASYSSIEHFTITTGSGNDNITTANGNDIVNLGSGDDVVDVGSGIDQADGGIGIDGLSADLSGRGSAMSINLQAGTSTGNAFTNFEYFGTITGTAFADTFVTTSAARNETLNLGDGDDTATVLNGSDTVNGGLGNDRLIVDFSASTRAIVMPNGPPTINNTIGGYNGFFNDFDGSTVTRQASFTSVENFTITTGSGNDSIATGNGNDVVNLGLGDDFVDLGAGVDQADGGGGIDGFSADLSARAAGVDINLQTGTSPGNAFVNFEYFGTITGTAFADNFVTTSVNKGETLNMGAGDDTATLVAGSDSVNGGLGNDRLILDYSAATRDILTFSGPSANPGPEGGFNGTISDTNFVTVEHQASYTSIEQFTITTGSGNDSITTATGDDIVRTGGGNDTVNAGGGDDLVDGGDGNDVLDGGLGTDTVSYASATAGVTVSLALTGSQNTVGAGSDTLSNFENLTGSAFADTLTGDSGNNVIDGGAGSDAMAGGLGNDRYIVDNVGDTISELSGEGSRDFVFSKISYSLQAAAFVEVLSAYDQAATTALNLTGNDHGQEIYGNAGANILQGGTGRDVIAGLDGDDVLSGGSGAANELYGGTGNDTYIVASSGDTIVELAGGGNDTIQTALSYYAMSAANVENLVGTSASGQTLVGNADDNRITGGVGNDELAGGAGNDTYVIGNVGDTIYEAAGGGTDTIETSLSYYFMSETAVENLTYTGAGGFYGHGNSLANVITGGAGNDLLDGGLGADTLIGNAGADSFLFDSALGGGNVDTIVGFVSGSDRIFLDNTIFTALGEGGLSTSAFVVGTAAQDADDRIIYDPTTGNLFYDADGNGAGAAVLFANLQGHPALVAGDFAII